MSIPRQNLDAIYFFSILFIGIIRVYRNYSYYYYIFVDSDINDVAYGDHNGMLAEYRNRYRRNLSSDTE